MLGGMLPCPEIEDIIFMNNIIKDYIYNLDIPLGTSIRLDCPICDGTNTLSVTQFPSHDRVWRKRMRLVPP